MSDVAPAPEPTGPAAPLLGEEVLDAVLNVLVQPAITIGEIGKRAEAVLAALEPLVAALVAERERAAYERGHRDGVEDAL